MILLNNPTIQQSNNPTIEQSNNPTIQIALPRDSSLLHFNVKSVLLTLEQMFH
jgi:hypothetical protein